MMTVAEFAKLAGYTTQTVYRWLNRVKQNNPACLTVKKNGITYITEAGVTALTENFKQGLTDVEPELNPVKHVEQDENHYLRAELAAARAQNAALQNDIVRHLERYAALSEQLAELARNNQLLLGAEQARTNPALIGAERGEAVPKKRWFARWFGRE